MGAFGNENHIRSASRESLKIKNSNLKMEKEGLQSDEILFVCFKLHYLNTHTRKFKKTNPVDLGLVDYWKIQVNYCSYCFILFLKIKRPIVYV